MTLSMPVLVGLGVLFAALLFLVLRRRGGRSDLMSPPRGLGEAPRPPAQMPAAPAASPGGLTPEIEQQVRELLAAGQKINAVKLVRQATGLGLKEALDLVEAL